MKNLVKMTRSAYSTARANRTLVTPNVALISDEVGKIEYTPFLPTSDIGIASWENGVRKFYSLEEWNALETKPTALGVYVFAEDAQFIIFRSEFQNTSYKWSTTEILVEGCASANDLSAAKLDYAGAANTQAVIDALNRNELADAPMFTYARGLSPADGSTPYVPALGELELIKLNATQINQCRGALSLANIDTSNIAFCSTQSMAYKFWSYYSSAEGYTVHNKAHSNYRNIYVLLPI